MTSSRASIFHLVLIGVLCRALARKTRHCEWKQYSRVSRLYPKNTALIHRGAILGTSSRDTARFVNFARHTSPKPTILLENGFPRSLSYAVRPSLPLTLVESTQAVWRTSHDIRGCVLGIRLPSRVSRHSFMVLSNPWNCRIAFSTLPFAFES